MLDYVRVLNFRIIIILLLSWGLYYEYLQKSYNAKN